LADRIIRSGSFASILACPRHVRLSGQGNLGNGGCPVLPSKLRRKMARRANHQKTCPAPLAKIFRLARRANHLYKLAPSHPTKGRIASRHERAVGCDGRDSVGRATGSQGGSSRERSAGARTNDAANRLRQNSPDGTRPGKTFGVRWSRTAKSCGPGAPMLASSLAEMHPAQPGLRCIINPQGDGGKKARSPGRARSKP
jgi:hypothetical protein